MQGLPLVVVQGVIGEGPGIGLAGCPGQHLGQFRHPLAMAAGVGALGVDGTGQQLDQGFEQGLLAEQQALVLDGHRGGP